MSNLLRIRVALALLIASCGNEGKSADDPVTPILARASALTHTCSVRTERVAYRPLYWSYAGHDSISTASGTWVSRVEAAQVIDYQPTERSFVVSPIAVDGALGARTKVNVEDADGVTRPALVPLDDGGFALLWGQRTSKNGSTADLGFAPFDAQGNVVLTPKILSSGEPAYVTALRVARTPEGRIGVVWNASASGKYDEIRMQVIDDQGTVISPVQRVGERSLAVPQIVADGRGFALLYRTFDEQRPARHQVHFVRYDAAGARITPSAESAITEPSRHATSGGFAADGFALLARPDGYLAAWHEASPAADDDRPRPTESGAYIVIRLARLDAEGKLLESARLRAPEDSVDEIEPVFVPHGDQVAVLWGRGTHIYTCGGCVPDQDVQLVLIDPRTLTPVSNVVNVQPKAGGLLKKRASLRDAVVMTTFEVTFHTSSEPGFAAFECKPDGG